LADSSLSECVDRGRPEAEREKVCIQLQWRIIGVPRLVEALAGKKVIGEQPIGTLQCGLMQ